MIGVDVFSGAGGMSLGATLAGIDVRMAIDADPHAAATYAGNFPSAQVLCRLIENVKRRDLPNTTEPTILFGGPPCQGFSTSNQRNRSASNRNNWLFKEFLRIVRLWHPDWVVFENVKGILETEGGFFFREAVAGLERIGYAVSHGTLNAVDFGVPQRRSRVFAIASRHGIRVPLPEPLQRPSVTVSQALADLPDLPNGASFDRLPYKAVAPSPYARAMRQNLKECAGHYVTRSAAHIIKRYKHVPPGGNWESIPARLMGNYADRTRCHTGIYHRLRQEAPSIVIGNYRKNMLIHPAQHRGLSVREAARIQSFPDWYSFRGSIGFQQQQVGNAVPPLLARAVFQEILAAGGGGR